MAHGGKTKTEQLVPPVRLVPAREGRGGSARAAHQGKQKYHRSSCAGARTSVSVAPHRRPFAGLLGVPHVVPTCRGAIVQEDHCHRVPRAPQTCHVAAAAGVGQLRHLGPHVEVGVVVADGVREHQARGLGAVGDFCRRDGDGDRDGDGGRPAPVGANFASDVGPGPAQRALVSLGRQQDGACAPRSVVAETSVVGGDVRAVGGSRAQLFQLPPACPPQDILPARVGPPGGGHRGARPASLGGHHANAHHGGV